MRKKTLGVLLMVAPPILLVTTISGYAIASFVIAQLAEGGAESIGPIGGLINLALGGVGLVSMLGIVPAFIGGAVMMSQRDDAEIAALKAKPAYAGLTDDQISFVTKPSWGAFFCTPVWGISNKLYVWSVASLIPVIGIYPWFKLTLDGRRLAWEEGRWEGFAPFQKRQTISAWIIVALLVIAFASSALSAFNAATELRASATSSASSTKWCERLVDADQDGLSDYYETKSYKTDPTLADTDADGYSDGVEVRGGYNPNGSGMAEKRYLEYEKLAELYRDDCE